MKTAAPKKALYGTSTPFNALPVNVALRFIPKDETRYAFVHG